MPKMDCLKISAFAEKNGKNTMEDRHFTFRHRNGVYVAGVCDGHGGDFCSDFVARDLPPKLSAEMDYHVDHETAMRRAIRGTDWDLCSRLVGRWKKSGTTAVVSLITDSEIITAWAGDSQAVLVRPNTEAIPLVTVHRCDNEKERERIQKAGGTVTCHRGQYRLNGALSVSRSLGDSEYRPGLTGVPEVTHTPLTGTEEYLVLGSDGLFDCLPFESIRHSVYRSYMRHNGCLDNVSKDLYVRAQNEGASDNITIVTIFFTQQLSRPYQSEDELRRVSRLSHFAQWDDGTSEEEVLPDDKFSDESVGRSQNEDEDTAPSSRPPSSYFEVPAKSDKHQSILESSSSLAPTCKAITLCQKVTSSTPAPKAAVVVRRSFSSPPPVPANSPNPATDTPPSSPDPVVRVRPMEPRPPEPCLSKLFKPHMYDQWQRVPKKVKSVPSKAPLPLKKVSINNNTCLKSQTAANTTLRYDNKSAKKAAKAPGRATATHKVSSAPVLNLSKSVSSKHLAPREAISCSKHRELSSSGSSLARPKKSVSQARGCGDEKPKKKKNIIRRALKSGKKTGQEVLEGGRKALKTSRQVLRTKVAWVGTHINRLGSAVSRKNRVNPLAPG
ncbi:PPM1F [Branchiostoma lanceolatum]|uniref:protein-serine/threonine phosphatase n=1 Tax=Branchiostoma lanceolatum TaxID=7740 RepID=A0A8J9YXN0_BRALA|nr:PPM1F [Branchiostoma lanceolatum]